MILVVVASHVGCNLSIVKFASMRPVCVAFVVYVKCTTDVYVMYRVII